MNMIKLPKLTTYGEYKDTAIDASQIKGIEPKTLSYKGKTYAGAKVYTTGGTYFKVFCDPVLLMMHAAYVIQNNILASEAPNLLSNGSSKMLVSGTQQLPAQEKVTVKQLPAPKQSPKNLKFW